MKLFNVLILIYLCISGASAIDFSYNGQLTQTYIQTTGNQPYFDKYMFDRTDEGSWKFTEMTLGGSVDINEKFRVGLQGISRVYGNYGNYDVTLDWGYADYRFTDYFGVRVGKVKTALGLYNESRDIDSARTSIFLSQDVYEESYRAFINSVNGASIYGSFEKDTWGTFDYQMSFGNVDIADDFFFNDQLSQVGVTKSPEFSGDWHATLSLEYAVPWGSKLDGLKLAFSHSEFRAKADIAPVFGPRDFEYDLDVSTTIYSVEYDQYKYTLGAEFMHRQFGPKIPDYVSAFNDAFALNATTHPTGFLSSGWNQILSFSTNDLRAYYVYGAYHFTEKYTMQLMYSETDHRGRTDTDRNAITFSQRYDFSDYTVGKLEYMHINDDNGKWGAFLARLGYSF